MFGKQVNFDQYTAFVNGVTSNETNNIQDMINRLNILVANYPDINFSLMMNSSVGLASESGELGDIIKKVIWQGKEPTDELVQHIAKELGDIIFYWTNMCRAFGFDSNEVIEKNVDKLSSRYPGGFSIKYSENRKEGDI